MGIDIDCSIIHSRVICDECDYCESKSTFFFLFQWRWIYCIFDNKSFKRSHQQKNSMHIQKRRMWWKKCWAVFGRYSHLVGKKSKLIDTRSVCCLQLARPKRKAYTPASEMASIDFCTLQVVQWRSGSELNGLLRIEIMKIRRTQQPL